MPGTGFRALSDRPDLAARVHQLKARDVDAGAVTCTIPQIGSAHFQYPGQVSCTLSQCAFDFAQPRGGQYADTSWRQPFEPSLCWLGQSHRSRGILSSVLCGLPCGDQSSVV